VARQEKNYSLDIPFYRTDYPYDAASGDIFLRETINSVEEMDISDENRKKIFEDNARKLFQLPV
jgi:predicted TIM-barrel fold metal-dependent hydrolase